MKQRCPCHSGQNYENCCQPLHLGLEASNAERLMRARYSAYTLKNVDFIKKSWHHSTRPNDLTEIDLQGLKWLGLEIIESLTQDTQHATVTFKAKFRTGTQKTQTLHEISHFVLENGHWYYISGTMLPD
jgi:SEC-C motif-containing protein